MKKLYVGMGAAVEKDAKFLILKRSESKDFAPNTWEVITGRIEEEESPRDGILREILEETGLNAEIVMPIETGFFYRGGKEFPMVFISYWCRYLDGDVRLGWEHNQFKWASIEEILQEPTMNHFYRMFERIHQLKQHLPEDIIIN
ncbi:MAG: NUDIX domain-containing protein [Candidatus Thorarchaeota archaeon]|jgi:8-oxo-dGTP diphosphatase